MFEGLTDEERTSILLELPSGMTEADSNALLEKIEDCMLRAFRDGVGAGRG